MQVRSELPTIYVDQNVFRYVSRGEVVIDSPERFRWVYSTEHFNEVIRTGNKDALDGMERLGAVELRDVLNERFESVGNVVLLDYIAPGERYDQHREAISGYEGFNDAGLELLLRFMGADNFPELSRLPGEVIEQIENLTRGLDAESRNEYITRQKMVSENLKDFINTNLVEVRPLEQFREGMGLPRNGANKEVKESASPIDEIWEIIGSEIKGVSKKQFFGIEPIPAMHGVPHTQLGAFAGAHLVLNMLGLSPDKGLSTREKIKKILSDGRHVGMASYCNGLLTADQRFRDKAQAIYAFVGAQTKTLFFPYDPKGVVIKLDVADTTEGKGE